MEGTLNINNIKEELKISFQNPTKEQKELIKKIEKNIKEIQNLIKNKSIRIEITDLTSFIQFGYGLDNRTIIESYKIKKELLLH